MYKGTSIEIDVHTTECTVLSDIVSRVWILRAYGRVFNHVRFGVSIPKNTAAVQLHVDQAQPRGDNECIK